MGCISVVVPVSAVESGEVAVAVDDVLQAALVAVPWALVLPAGADVAAGVTGPTADEAVAERPMYGWIASCASERCCHCHIEKPTGGPARRFGCWRASPTRDLGDSDRLSQCC